MKLVFEIIAVWFLVSLLVSLLLGAFIHAGNGRER
jgi:hypothetical protein